MGKTIQEKQAELEKLKQENETAEKHEKLDRELEKERERKKNRRPIRKLIKELFE